MNKFIVDLFINMNKNFVFLSNLQWGVVYNNMVMKKYVSLLYKLIYSVPMWAYDSQLLCINKKYFPGK